MKTKVNSSGYTLIELTIVIVLIGMMVSLVLFGTNLLKSSKLNSVYIQANNYATAVKRFNEKYNALPGDMVDAASYWSACGGSDDICNGDGDEQIAYDIDDDIDESFSFWNHLALSGIISGSFDGSGSGTANIGANVPESKIANGGFIISYGGVGFTGEHILIFASETTNNTLTSGVISGIDSYSIDKKFDDGVFSSGKIRSLDGDGGSNCIDTTPSPDEYNLETDSEDCILGFAIGAL